ncbi:unnamed protein product, partial [Candidula unifasciata]
MTESLADNSFPATFDVESTINVKAILFAFTTVFVAVILLGGVNTILSEMPAQDTYSVVIDAGSTGSRVSVFHFRTKNTAISKVVLEEEVFQSVEPGISCYANNPIKAVETLHPLLHRAIERVPRQYQPSTLITFKATAGLRLLPRKASEKIINVVRELLQSTPFYLPDPSKVEIMSGENEGLFAWITVNFLLHLLWKSHDESTVTIFDLGGGSVQAAFEILEMSGLPDFLARDVIKMLLLKSKFNIFTK